MVKSARIGVLREMVRTWPGHEEGVVLFEQAVADAKKAGAVVFDVRTGLDLVAIQGDAAASSFEVATAINKYLAALPQSAPIRTVDEMIAKGGKLVKPGIIAASKSTIPLERDPRLDEFASEPALRRRRNARAAALGPGDDGDEPETSVFLASPLHLDGPARHREGAVLGGVGGQLVQGHAQGRCGLVGERERFPDGADAIDVPRSRDRVVGIQDALRFIPPLTAWNGPLALKSARFFLTSSGSVR